MDQKLILRRHSLTLKTFPQVLWHCTDAVPLGESNYSKLKAEVSESIPNLLEDKEEDNESQEKYILVEGMDVKYSDVDRYKRDRYYTESDEYDDDEYDDDDYDDDEYDDDEYEEDEYKDDKYEDDKYEDDEYEDDYFEDDEYEDYGPEDWSYSMEDTDADLEDSKEESGIEGSLESDNEDQEDEGFDEELDAGGWDESHDEFGDDSIEDADDIDDDEEDSSDLDGNAKMLDRVRRGAMLEEAHDPTGMTADHNLGYDFGEENYFDPSYSGKMIPKSI